MGNEMKRLETKKCAACKKNARAPTWRCRGCDRLVCEHFCGFKKDDGTATCGRCQLSGPPRDQEEEEQDFDDHEHLTREYYRSQEGDWMRRPE